MAKTYRKVVVGTIAGVFLGWIAITGTEPLGIGIVHAQPAGVMDLTTSTISQIVGVVITVLHVLTWLIFEALSLVMDPNFMFNKPAVGEGALLNMLHQIWQLSRDLMNVIFAILLVVGAVMTVINPKGGELLKSFAPKFIMAVILVNFSWFGPRVILDVANVATYTVYQIPSMLGSECVIPLPAGQVGPPQPCVAITNMKFFEQTNALVDNGGGNFVDPADAAAGNWRCPLPRIVCYQQRTFTQIGNGVTTSKNIINGLVVNYARLATLAQLRPGGPPAEGVLQIGQLIMFLAKMIVVLLIHIALFFPLLAMTVAFFIRIPIIWFTMAFMPFTFLGFVMGERFVDLDTMKLLWNKFLTAAFLPTMVAVPITIGFVMITAGLSTPPPEIPADIALLNGAVPLFQGISDFWQILWLMIALFVLWSGVFAALKKDEIIAKFVQPIESMGETLGRLAYKLPLAAPILPAASGRPDDGGTSLLQMGKAFNPRNIENLINITGKIPNAKDLAGGGKGTATEQALQQVVRDRDVRRQMDDTLRNNVRDTAAGAQALEKLLKDLSNNPQFRGRHEEREIVEALSREFSIDRTLLLNVLNRIRPPEKPADKKP